MSVAAISLSGVALVQPALWPRVVVVLAVVAAITGCAELLGRQGHPHAAAWVLTLGLIGMITINSLSSGGISSPGMRSLLVFVLIAGVLLGERPAFGVAVLSSVIGLGLVLLEQRGMLPAQTVQYGPPAQWLLLSLYLGVTVVLMRFFAASVDDSIRTEAVAVIGEQRANDRVEAVLKASGIGVWSYHVSSDTYRADARTHDILESQGDPALPVPAAMWRQLVISEDLPALVAMLTRLAEGGASETQSLRVRTASGELRYLDITCIADADGSEVITGLVHDRTSERQAELARVEATGALGERVKELTLLHAASRLLRSGRPLDSALLDDLAAMIPQAFRYPDRAMAQIRCGDMIARTATWRDVPARLAQRLACGNPSGEIVVGYADDGNEGMTPFLPEERELLASLAEMLEAFIERDHAERLRVALDEQLRQSQRMEALGTLAGGIAHDFNNILTAIGGNIALAKSDAAPDHPVHEPLDQLDRAATRASELVRRILLFSRRQESEMRSTRLEQIVDEVAKLLQASTPARIRIIVRQDADLPPLLADESQLHQAVMNLGTNAVYAMGDREGEVAFELDAVDRTEHDPVDDPTTLPPGRYARLVVRDAGAGIEPRIRDRLFDPFFTTKGSAGTGLGLAVVHGVVQTHAGHISVESTVGEGTAFTLLLPAQPMTAQTVASGERTLVRGQGERVLYVDDEEAIVFVMVKLLRSIGFECQGFTSPLEALQAIRTAPDGVDAIVTDFSMPSMSGALLAREAQRIRPGVPVIVSSGFTADEIETGPETGVHAVVPKPVSVVELSHTLATLLGRPPVRDAA